MEHIVQFAIGIDDNAIRKVVESTAEKQIIDDIRQQVLDKMLEKSGWGAYNSHAKPEDPLKEWVRREIINFMEEHKEEILNKASHELAEHLARSKKVRNYISEKVGIPE